MKRSWSYSEGQGAAPLNERPLNERKPPLSRGASFEACPSPDRRGSARESPSESASSRETWPTDQQQDNQVHNQVANQAHNQVQVQNQQQHDHHQGRNRIKRCAQAAAAVAAVDKVTAKEEDDGGEQTVVHRVANMDRISLRDVARDSIDLLSDRMHSQPDEYLDILKAELRDILAGTGGPRQRDEFTILQKLVHSRRDASPASLMRAHRVVLEILVAIKTGIQAFLHPDISVTQSVLVDVFFYIRCRNMACQSQIPVDDCSCEVCGAKNGFCSSCMCIICGKFDFDVNTSRWVGCDTCSHWTHTDCAIRVKQISSGPSPKKRNGSPEMIFRCRSCGGTSELLGWARDVFKACASDWNQNELVRELDSIRRIFHGSEDHNGKRLFQKSEESLERLRAGGDPGIVLKEMHRLFQETEMENSDDGGEDKVVEPQDACARIAEVVKEAVMKMETVASEKAVDVKRARFSLEACDRELEDKRRELTELQFERQRKKQQIDELETIIRLKQAEAEMFQQRADEARRDAEELQRIALAKSEKVEEEYASRYLKIRLNEAEAERRYIFEKIKLQEMSRTQNDPAQMLAMCKIQYLLNRGSNKRDAAETSAPTP